MILFVSALVLAAVFSFFALLLFVGAWPGRS